MNNRNIFRIDGMTCDGCVATIKTKLEMEENISEAIITLVDSKLELVSTKNFKISQLNSILSTVGSYTVSNDLKNEKNKIVDYFSTYKPIFITISLVCLLSLINFFNYGKTFEDLMRFLMGYFFIIFSFLKLQNIKQFAISFANYDPITKTIFKFGLIYPFVELFLGVLFLTGYFLLFSNILTLIILIPQSYGIYKKLRNKEIVNCACLGSSFNVPLSNLTVIENLTMCLMAIYFITATII